MKNEITNEVKELTEEDIKIEQQKIADAQTNLREIRDKIKNASANQPKLKVKKVERTIHGYGILQGEQVVLVEFAEDGDVMSIGEIIGKINDRAKNGCRMIHVIGNVFEQDKREFLTLFEYFPEFYVTIETDGSRFINEYRPPYGHMVVRNGKVMNTVYKELGLHDELIFKIGNDEQYAEFKKFYDKKGVKMISAGVKVLVVPDIDSEYVGKLQKYIVKDDLRVRYSFPIQSLFK